jgi:hypothetical protein
MYIAADEVKDTTYNHYKVSLFGSISASNTSYTLLTGSLYWGDSDFVSSPPQYWGTVADYTFSHTHSFTPAGTVSAHTHTYNKPTTGTAVSVAPSGHTHTITPAGTVSSHTHTGPSHTHTITAE